MNWRSGYCRPARPPAPCASPTPRLLADKDYAGWLGGALVLADRVANIAPQALASASSRNESAAAAQ